MGGRSFRGERSTSKGGGRTRDGLGSRLGVVQMGFLHNQKKSVEHYFLERGRIGKGNLRQKKGMKGQRGWPTKHSSTKTGRKKSRLSQTRGMTETAVPGRLSLLSKS